MINARGRFMAALIAFIAAASLLIQFYFSLTEGRLLQTLGYFTIWTNLLVAALMADIALQKWPRNEIKVSILSAATLYITLVGLIYHFVLSSQWHLEGWRKVADTGFHYVVPSMMVFFWALFVPKARLSYRDGLAWMAFPLAYCVVALARGALTGWYPYPFFNASKIGWTSVVVNAVGLTAIFYFFGLILIFLMKNLSKGFKS